MKSESDLQQLARQWGASHVPFGPLNDKDWPASFRRERNLQLLEESLGELDRRILLVVLDEAQNYTHGSLEEVRLLLGLNLPQAPAFARLLPASRLRAPNTTSIRGSCRWTFAGSEAAFSASRHRPIGARPLVRPVIRQVADFHSG